MKIPNITIQQLLEAGVHLGHKTLRWNPKMKKYIFGKRDSIHIIDLTQTLELTKLALEKKGETLVHINFSNSVETHKFKLKSLRNIDRKSINILRNKEISLNIQ